MDIIIIINPKSKSALNDRVAGRFGGEKSVSDRQGWNEYERLHATTNNDNSCHY